MIQMAVGHDKQANINKARQLVLQVAKQHKPHIIMLPECFNSPYGIEHFAAYAEPATTDGETFQMLQSMARDAQVYLVGGSMPESHDQKLYNTCCVFDPEGTMVAKHRKAHLFDIDIPGKITFQESAVLAAGDKLTHFAVQHDGKKVNVGVGICYDLRFPEMCHVASRVHDCQLMLFPAAFNTTTGPRHWELLVRARAMDNQMFVAACSPAHVTDEGYPAYGHSVICSPDGQVLQQMPDAKEGVIFQILDMAQVSVSRQQIPVNSQRRYDLYTQSVPVSK